MGADSTREYYEHHADEYSRQRATAFGQVLGDV